MSGVPITIIGTMASDKETKQVTITGIAALSGLGVGGGPMPGGGGGSPSHPIYWPPYPDQGLPGNQPYPDQGLPGSQPHPDQGLPGEQPRPSFPIYLPPGSTVPPGSGYPPVAGQPLPPEGGGEPPKPVPGWSAKVVWTEQTGWIVVLVPGEGTLVPTPSR